jgi:hypothetical protein
MRVFDFGVLREIVGRERGEVIEGWQDCIVSFMICAPKNISPLRMDGMGETCATHGRDEKVRVCVCIYIYICIYM